MRVKASHLMFTLGVLLCAGAALGASCGDNDGPTTPPPAARPAPTLRLLVITDLKGYLEPCGCTSRPLGGIDRMAAEVASRRAEVPSLLLVAGDLFFDGAGHGGVDADAAATQELWKAETLIDILERLGVNASAPGALDLSHGAQVFSELAELADFPLLSAGIQLSAPAGEDAQPSEPLTLPSTFVAEVGGVKVGVLGVGELTQPDGTLPTQVERTMPIREAARVAAAGLREGGAQIIIALVRGDRRTARRIATGVEGVDFVVQAGLDEEEAIAPGDADGTFLLHGGRQGQGLLVVDVWREGEGTFSDLSDWTHEEERARLERRIADLRTRVAEWEADESVDEANVSEQRRRLADMERQLVALSGQRPVDGNGFSAHWQELPPDHATDGEIAALVDAYDRRVNDNNQRVFANLTPAPVPEGEANYLGSASCQSCHEGAFRWWSGHAHGRAYTTLVDQHKQFNLSCVGCHVTGYMKPGGSTVTHNLEGALTHVGCEACHGPGSRHAAEPEREGLMRAEVQERVCVTCHNPEHSDTFNYAAYSAMITVPGHGRPLP